MRHYAFIYLLQDGKDQNTQVYKIGKTLQKSGDARTLNRLKAYSVGTVPYHLWNVSERNLDMIERKIKAVFRQIFKLVRGSEWFEGDVKQMKKEIDTIIENIDDNPDVFEDEIVEDCISIENTLDDEPEIEHVSELVCKTCGQDFNTKCTCQRPMQKKDSSIESFPCPTCYKCFSRNNLLQKHIPECKHVRNVLQCFKCGRVLSCRASKCKHIKRCKAEPPYLKPPAVDVGTPNISVLLENVKQILEKLV